MGPLIILDKSALQSLSQGEIYCLNRHFFPVVAPVLLVEILGDLKKEEKSEGLKKGGVRILAGKLLGGGYSPPYYLPMVIGNLAGNDVPMDGRVPILGGREVVDKQGAKGISF